MLDDTDQTRAYAGSAEPWPEMESPEVPAGTTALEADPEASDDGRRNCCSKASRRQGPSGIHS